MKNKKLIATLCVFIGVLLVAGILYSRMGADLQPQGLVTTGTEPVTETTQAATEETDQEAAAPTVQVATEAAQPQIYPAMDFTVKDFDGNDVKLSDYFGKPIVLNFWAYWCGPCQMEMPEFNAKYEELGGDVVFLMVHADPDTTQGKSLVVAEGYSFPVVYDEKGEATAAYCITAFPTTFFVDAEGNLQAYYVGAMNAELLQMGIDTIYSTEG